MNYEFLSFFNKDNFVNYVIEQRVLYETQICLTYACNGILQDVLMQFGILLTI